VFLELSKAYNAAPNTYTLQKINTSEPAITMKAGNHENASNSAIPPRTESRIAFRLRDRATEIPPQVAEIAPAKDKTLQYTMI